MKKAVINYWIDLATGVAFMVSAATGVMFLFPSLVQAGGVGMPTILGISTTLLHTLHDWAGVAMAAGVGLHLVLHTRWIVHMTRRVAGGPAAAARAATQPGPAAASPRPATAVARAAASSNPAAASLASLQRMGAQRRRHDHRDQAFTRKRFITGAAAVGGAALLVGLGLVGRHEANSADAQTTHADGESYGGSEEASAASSESTTTTATSARVAVDQGLCVGCGYCLQECPRGVFAAGASTVEAQNPDACSLCGRCLQVCRPAAITLNG